LGLGKLTERVQARREPDELPFAGARFAVAAPNNNKIIFNR